MQLPASRYNDAATIGRLLHRRRCRASPRCPACRAPQASASSRSPDRASAPVSIAPINRSPPPGSADNRSAAGHARLLPDDGHSACWRAATSSRCRRRGCAAGRHRQRDAGEAALGWREPARQTPARIDRPARRDERRNRRRGRRRQDDVARRRGAAGRLPSAYAAGHRPDDVRRAHRDARRCRWSNSVGGAVHALDPELPLADVRTMEDVVDATLARPRTVSVLLTAFALIALVLAGVGVYGVMAYSVVAAHAGDRRAHGARRDGAIGVPAGARPGAAAGRHRRGRGACRGRRA